MIELTVTDLVKETGISRTKARRLLVANSTKRVARTKKYSFFTSGGTKQVSKKSVYVYLLTKEQLNYVRSLCH